MPGLPEWRKCTGSSAWELTERMDLPQSVTFRVASRRPAVARARARSGVAASLAQATTQKGSTKSKPAGQAGKFNRLAPVSAAAVRYFPFPDRFSDCGP